MQELVCNGSYGSAANVLAPLVLQGGSPAQEAMSALKQARQSCPETRGDVCTLEMLLTGEAAGALGAGCRRALSKCQAAAHPQDYWAVWHATWGGAPAKSNRHL
jgi:hypothetical protein